MRPLREASLRASGEMLPADEPAQRRVRHPRPHLLPEGARTGAPAKVSGYQVVGPAEGRPIVFIHGTRVNRGMWRAQQVGLADAYRVVTLDLPGHGSLADRHFRFSSAVEEVARIIDTAAGGRAVVVGFSLGGYVAMELAARHPKRVAGLAIVGASSEPWTVLPEPLRLAARLVLAMDRNRIPRPSTFLRAAVALAGPDLAFGPRRVGRASGRSGDDGEAGGRWFDGGGQAVLDIMGRRFQPRFAAYQGPSLILNGARDRLMRRHEAAFLAAARHGSLVVLPGIGHVCNDGAADAFNRVIRRFADEADWRS